MASLLITDGESTFLVVSEDNSIYVSKLEVGDSGFIHYDDVNPHDLTFSKIHKLTHHGRCDGYELVENLCDKELPLHEDML